MLRKSDFQRKIDNYTTLIRCCECKRFVYSRIHRHGLYELWATRVSLVKEPMWQQSGKDIMRDAYFVSSVKVATEAASKNIRKRTEELGCAGHDATEYDTYDGYIKKVELKYERV